MTVRFILATAALLGAGCTNLGPDYEHADRARCGQIGNQYDRQECMDRARDNARREREEQRPRY